MTRRTRNTSRSAAFSTSQLCRLYTKMGASWELHAKMGPRRAKDVVTPHDPWTNFGLFFDGCRLLPEGLSSAFFPGIFWTHGRTNIAGISRVGEEVAWHPGIYRFQTCVLCHEGSHWEIFAINSSLPFVVLTVFFQLSPKIRDHMWGRNKDQFKTESFAVFESSCFFSTER